MTIAAVQIRVAALADMEAVLLRPGATVGGKVLERNGAHGLLLLAGAPVVAELPEHVAAGARLRLQVTDVTAERVTLRLLEATEAAPAAPAAGTTAAHAAQAAAPTPEAAFALALPGGGVIRLQVAEREAGAGGGGRDRAAAVALRYDSPALGRIDFRLAPGAVAVHVPAGQPAERATAAAGALRDAIERATGAPTQVTVHPRTTAFDVRG